ncbi:hypothetical protein N7520_010688 [Penicillium odoratum]|uniref:uncharacterized protein n=1 Tax=Penicillium odoratum TaxID=1167516 RepID=UPI0025488CFD|nr:uncharacterized protein N7520_010688 [Penicillium odoratum]KAJ5745506.1 hypothetical protein N7520_010688 [Penicillium odoratum]
MLLSRTAYRAALLHLTVNPLLARAVILGTLKAPSHVPAPSSRLYNVLFPQCSPLANTCEQSRQAHTMSSPNEPPKQDTQPQSEEVSPPSEQLYLPSSESADQTHRLDVSAEGGSTVSLGHLGPMVVNVDGTLAQIGNWDKMTEIEQKNTLRILGKRNKQRLDALKAAEAAKEQK